MSNPALLVSILTALVTFVAAFVRVIHGGGANRTDQPRRAVHLSYCLGWLRTEENNYLSIPPAIAAALPSQAQEVLGYSVYDGIARGGGYLGMVRMQDPVDLLARDEL